ncbi:LysR family transcriptional regulator [Aestuariibacter sp. AA17]|uniref:LysR family transcriptional regulator n=1 Tax=Fluctibacter corallii TaxID=2984329 RepID=A0ABT3A9F9_9ALTE|nr:LysR family transcriptional regulator [Aestuariibacter sp. AA17]MCV2885268.1 LysR family transcriptional regulator [Aestuariibacter sp. AA17]
MSVTYRQVESFVRVAQSSNFAEAAERLHLSQPALSLSLKKLESMLGGKLISRSTRSVRLTPEGKEFLPIALRLLNDWDRAVEDMQSRFSAQQGKLSIAAMPSFAATVLPNILSLFHSHFPNISLSVSDVVMETVFQQVREGRAELGFTFESDRYDGVAFHTLFYDAFTLVVPPNHALDSESVVSWFALQDFPFVAMNRGSTIRGWLDDIFSTKALAVNVVAEANQLATIGQCVKFGLGVSVVPQVCAEQMRQNGLVCIPLKEVWLRKKVGIIRSTHHELSVAADRFWSLVREDDTLIFPY